MESSDDQAMNETKALLSEFTDLNFCPSNGSLNELPLLWKGIESNEQIIESLLRIAREKGLIEPDDECDSDLTLAELLSDDYQSNWDKEDFNTTTTADGEIDRFLGSNR